MLTFTAVTYADWAPMGPGDKIPSNAIFAGTDKNGGRIFVGR